MEINRIVRCLYVALIEARNEIKRFHVHIHINGIDRQLCPFTQDATGVNNSYIQIINRICKDLFKLLPNVHITLSPESGKINAVNFGLISARTKQASLFFCVDNDILFFGNTINQIINLYHRNKKIFSGVACAKCPYTNQYSSNFQRKYSLCTQLSFKYNLYPKRPTGSFYAIDPFRIIKFPEMSNEGDFLDRQGVLLSELIVYSEFPKTIEAEILRRKRIFTASNNINYTRIHDDIGFLNSRANRQSTQSRLLPASYWDSLELYKSVIRTSRGMEDTF